MKNEADYKRWMVKQVQERGGYARRIEDQFAVGTLDLVLIPVGAPVFFVEVKMVTGNRFKPSLRQFVEMQRIENSQRFIDGLHYAHAILIGCKEGQLYFSEAVADQHINECYAPPKEWHFVDQLHEFYNGVLE